MKTLTIKGREIHDIPSFYAEINRVFMADEGWKLGESLDAFDDLLYGGYGAVRGLEPIVLIWEDFEASRVALGIEATREHLSAKLRQPERYNMPTIRQKLYGLEKGDESTYFDTILDVIRDHPNVQLIER